MGSEKEFGEFLESFFKRAVERNLTLELEFDSQKFLIGDKELTLNGTTVLRSGEKNDES